MLSASSAPTVKATLPVVAATGEQRQALAGAVAAFASHLVGMGPGATGSTT